MTQSTHQGIPAWKTAVWLAAVAVLLSGALNLFAAQRARVFGSRTHSSQVLIERLASLLSHLLDVETSQRGYLLVGEGPYLAPFFGARVAVHADLDSLRARTGDGGGVSAEDVATLTQLANAKLAELDTTIALRQAGKVTDALAIVRGNSGKILMDSLRTRINALTQQEDTKLAARLRSEESWGNVVLLIVLLGVAVTAGVLVFLYRALAEYDRSQRAAMRELEKQMEDLEEMSRARFSSGTPPGAPPRA